MILPRIVALMRSLIKKSREGNVNWLPTGDLGLPTGPHDDFAVSLPEYSINIFSSTSDDEGAIHFNILDGAGRVISASTAGPAEAHYSLLEELLELARFKAFNVDRRLQEIERIIASADTIGVIPSEPEDDSQIQSF